MKNITTTNITGIPMIMIDGDRDHIKNDSNLGGSGTQSAFGTYLSSLHYYMDSHFNIGIHNSFASLIE